MKKNLLKMFMAACINKMVYEDREDERLVAKEEFGIDSVEYYVGQVHSYHNACLIAGYSVKEISNAYLKAEKMYDYNPQMFDIVEPIEFADEED